MAFSGGDDDEKKYAGDTAHIAVDEAMSKKMDLKKLAQLAHGMVEPKGATLVGAKGIFIGIFLGFEASAIENPVMAKKLLQGFILPTDKEAVNKLDLDMAITRFLHSLSRVAELEVEKQCADKELKRLKEEHDAALESLDIQDLQIDPDLVEEDEEEEKDVLDTNPPQ
ncbi:hypothetical protein Acr_10g0007480 [Actinidia rufa]|uniref:Uncharacterized protein n=1 Tax=Actinidia rufa TaxID=165716 RepID=A0A7J0F9T2_9ERIC|nr:hypothetical protein Acr_10g0007480 [Actinidia rufa]